MDSFPNNLLSMGQFCDADCTVTFTKSRVYVFNNSGDLVLDGFREKTGARMWRFNIHAPHPHTALQASPTHHNYTRHISSPSTTTTKMTCQPLYHLPPSSKAKLHLHHLCHLQSNPRESQPHLSQPHEDVQLHHQHAPRNIIDEPMICHLHEISSSISIVLRVPQKSQPSITSCQGRELQILPRS